MATGIESPYPREEKPSAQNVSPIVVGAFLLVPIAVVEVVLGTWGATTPVHAPRAAACLSNAKRMAAGLQLYAEGADGRLPSANWMDALAKEGTKDDFFRCPEVTHDVPTGYGYALADGLLGASLDTSRSAAQEPMLFDSVDLRRNAVAGTSTIPKPPRHGKGNNVAYEDGHVKLVKQP